MTEPVIIRPHEQRPGSRRTPLVVRWDGVLEAPPLPPSVEDMSLPHLCRGCGSIYDGGHVTVTVRYADCSMWDAPCCGRTHDSRHAWSGAPGERMGYIDLRERDRKVQERIAPTTAPTALRSGSAVDATTRPRPCSARPGGPAPTNDEEF